MKFITENFSAIVPYLASVVTFFGGYKLRKVKLKSSEADALSNIQKVYDTLTEQIKDEVATLRDDLKEVKSENRDQRKALILLQEDNRSLHKQISSLMSENNALKMELAKLRNENKQLVEQLQKYKRK